MAPFVEALVEATGVGPGDAVLDVACGTGFLARSAAARAGSTGRVVGADVDLGMLRVAATRPAADGRAIGWVRAGASDLPFRRGAFDAVTCQQGLQFFPDLEAAVTEAARVTRKGGHVAATVWASLERQPYFEAQYRAIEAIIGPGPSAPFAEAYVSSPDPIAAAFRAAGLGDVRVRKVVADVRLPSIVEFARGHLAAGRFGRAVSDARPDGLELATRSIVEQLASRTAPDGSATAPFASLLVIGRR